MGTSVFEGGFWEGLGRVLGGFWEDFGTRGPENGFLFCIHVGQTVDRKPSRIVMLDQIATPT